MAKTRGSGRQIMIICHYSPMKFRRLSALALVALLTGCAAGQQAPTTLIKQVTDGVDSSVADIKVRNVVVVALPDGSGTLISYLVNHSDTPDQLAAIAINLGNASIATKDGAALVLKKNQPIQFEGDTSNAKAKVTNLGAVPGQRISVDFYFASAGKLRVNALVVANTGVYSSIL